MAKNTKGRVNIPSSPSDLLTLAGLVYNKHLLDGSSSLLSHLEDSDWAVTGPKVAIAAQLHAEAEDLKRKMEDAYRERDKHLGEIKATVSNSAALLKAIYLKNPKKLGEWGFQIDDTVQAKKKDVPPTV
jgi:hypothetical protein